MARPISSNGRREQRSRTDADPFRIRLAIAEEAARIMADHGLRDFQTAKDKAVHRLGVSRRNAALPTNVEIEDALVRRLELFQGRALSQRRGHLLRVAQQVMELLEGFDPRLVGALLRGSITERTPVELHLFSETPDAVPLALSARSISYQSFDKKLRYPPKRYVRVPAVRFEFEHEAIEALPLALNDVRQAPLCPVDGRPMRRMSLRRVTEWLDSGAGALG